MTVRTRATNDVNITSQIADNTSQAITAANVRNMLTDVNDSSAFQSVTSSGTMSGVLVIDLNYPVQTVQPTGTPVAGFVSFNTTSRSSTISSLTKVIFLPPNVDVYATGWNGNWNWMGTRPSGFFANLGAILTLCSFGANENNVIAAFQQLGSG